MYDVIVIGAGVIGCAIARELSRLQLRTAVLEREQDVCCGTSKANSAIIHAGFDARPGSLMAHMNVQGNAMMDQLAGELDIPFFRNGSLVLCTAEQDERQLQILKARGEANGVPGLLLLSAAEVRRREPHIADEVKAALYAPTGGIVCPFEMTIALGENACVNGVEFFLGEQVTGIKKRGATFCINTAKGYWESRVVINAAGLYADELHNMVSSRKLHITPRLGEYLLLDKTAGHYVSHTLFQIPGKMGKGVLVTPTVHGNLLAGPTAENREDKEAAITTREGMEHIRSSAAKSVKGIPFGEVITSFGGLRAQEDRGDFVIEENPECPGFVDAAGIASPGLSSAPAIGVRVRKIVQGILHPSYKTDFAAGRKGIVRLMDLSPEERTRLIRENPAYGNMICRCEKITEGEVIDAIRRPLGARNLDGVKRRTRAGMGRCQGGFCTPRVIEILAREWKVPLEAVSKAGGLL